MENNRKTILIVDDAKFIRDILVERLSNDYDVLIAENGEEGESLFKAKKPDAVLLDINMPKMHGVDALQEMVAFNSQARVIMFSVEDSFDIIDDCKGFGAFDYIIKPFGMDTVYQSLHVALYDS